MLDEIFDVFDRDRRGQRPDGKQPPRKGIRGLIARITGGGHDDDPRISERSGPPGRDRNRDDDDDDDPRNDERYGRTGRGRRRDDDGPDFGFD